MTFGEKLKALRTSKKITQPKLSELLGVSINSICNYESGRSIPRDMKIYVKLAEIFDVDLEYLYTQETEFISQAQQEFGYRGKKGAEKLVAEVSGLFAGGELAEEDMDEMMLAIQEAYIIAKKNNKKYTPKKYVNKK